MVNKEKTRYNKSQEKEDFDSTDTPATRDEFEIGSHIKGLSDFLMTCNTPLTISIKGDWGTGKTSIMRQVKQYIKNENNKEENKKKVLNIWFNTWQFSQFSYDNQLPIILLSRLVSEICEKVNLPARKNKYGRELSNTFKNISNLIGGSSIDIIKHRYGFDLSRFTSNNKIDSFDQIEKIKENFGNLVKSSTNEESDYERIVIFIDDLDRLAPKRAIELLETLKLFLDVENCVFVFAIDYDIVIRGASDKYGFDMNDPKEFEKGKNFFDKIIQVSYTVPTGEYKFDNFLNKFLNKNHIVEETLDDKDKKDEIGKEKDEDKDKVNLDNNDIIVEDLEIFLTNSVGENPRSIKRILNTFKLNRLIKYFDSKESLVLLGFICMEQAYPSIYSRFIHEIKATNEKTKDNEDMVKKIIEKINSEENEGVSTSALSLELQKLKTEEFLQKLLEVSDGTNKESLEKIINASISTSDQITEGVKSRWNVCDDFDQLLKEHGDKNNKIENDVKIMDSQAKEILNEIRSLFEDLKEELNEEYKSKPGSSRSTISLKRGKSTSIVDIQLQKNTISIELPLGKSLSNNEEIQSFLKNNKLKIPANNRLSLNIDNFKLLKDNDKMKEFKEIITVIVKNK